MALQSLTTTPTPSGTETVAPKPGPQDTNANDNLLGQPLVPAFVLSGLLVVGIVLMCWWKRLAARRMFLRLNAGVGEEEGRMGVMYPYPGPRTTLVIRPGRVMGPGMLLFAARGADLQAETLTFQTVGAGAGRRKKSMKLGPKPVLWDIHLGEEDGKEGEERTKGDRWRWHDMKPLSASYVPPQSSPVHQRQVRTQETCPDSNSIAASPSTEEPRTLPRWLRRQRADVRPDAGTRKVLAPQPSPSPPKVRISMLISMPTREGARQARPGPGRAEDSEVGIGELNLALGITEVEEMSETES